MPAGNSQSSVWQACRNSCCCNMKSREAHVDVRSGRACHHGEGGWVEKQTSERFCRGGKLQIEAMCLHGSGQGVTRPGAMLARLHFITSPWLLVFRFNVYHDRGYWSASGCCLDCTTDTWMKEKKRAWLILNVLMLWKIDSALYAKHLWMA